MKFHAIEALGEIGDRAALPTILPLYNETSLRKPVLEAIGKIGDVGTVPFLLKIIAEEDKLNLTALRALVRIAEASRPRIVEQAERSFIQRKFRESFPGREGTEFSNGFVAPHEHKTFASVGDAVEVLCEVAGDLRDRKYL